MRRVFGRTQQSIQQRQDKEVWDFTIIRFFRGTEREKAEPKRLRSGNKQYEALG